MPENFVYSEDFTSEGRSPPEPALSKAEWAGMTRKEREDDKEGARG
jgi:hypothetical protein